MTGPSACRSNRYAAPAAVAIAVAGLACQPAIEPPELGVMENRVKVERAVFVDAGSGSSPTHILDISWEGRDQELVEVMTSRGIAWVDRAGRQVDWAAFGPDVGTLFPGRTLKGTDPRFRHVGISQEGRALVYLDSRARMSASVPCGDCLGIDVWRDATPATDLVLVRWSDGKEARLLDGGGNALRPFRSEFYLTGAGLAGSEGLESAFVVLNAYPDGRGGSTASVFDTSGRALGSWSVPGAGRINTSLSVDGRPIVLSIEEGAVVQRSLPDGVVTGRLVVPDASRYRDARQVFLASGWRVVVLSGGSGVDYHVVSLVDTSGSIQYREAAEGRSYVVAVVGRDSNSFLLGSGHVVYRYTLR
jgi:hypothetical protein